MTDERTSRPTSVAIAIIGDEVLTHKVEEANARFAIRRLAELGVPLGRVEIIGDELDDIAATVRRLSETHDIVLTSGGLGPTHDDLTAAGVARAHDLPMVEHPEIAAKVKSLRPNASKGLSGIARVPEGTELLWGEPSYWPLLRVRNTFLFAGIPRIFCSHFPLLEPFLRGRAVHCVAVFLEGHESGLVEYIDATVAAFSDVAIGSYPRTTPRGEGAERWGVRLTFESTHSSRALAAADHLKNQLPEAKVVAVETTTRG